MKENRRIFAFCLALFACLILIPIASQGGQLLMFSLESLAFRVSLWI
jgi:hypothetical protein